MTSDSCPACGQRLFRLLEEVSRLASVEYFRCELCGHVWAVPKEGEPTIRHITVPRDRDPSPDTPKR